MKLSTINTGILLCKAECGDEYEDTAGAILRITDGDQYNWNMWDKLAAKAKKQCDKYVGSEYLGADIVFLDSINDESEDWEELLETDGYVWIEEPAEADYSPVEEKIWGTSITVTGSGYISIEGTGKHSNINYWVESISLEEISKQTKVII